MAKKQRQQVQAPIMTKKKETLTATQLRNARKRRSKQKKNVGNEENPAKRPRLTDPSLHYAAKPHAAPIVREAKQFFKGKVENFPVYVGAKEGWRTLAKLAVRNVDGDLTIGLFAPGSHDLVAAPNCPVHHPAINTAVAILQKQARLLKINAFDDNTGKGQLRHVALAVQRHTGAVQLTLVWNGEDSSDEAAKKDLTCLWKALVSVVDVKSSKKVEKTVLWHSVWVHYNSSWKHANAIFSHTGKWERLYSSSNEESCPMGGITEYLENYALVQVPLHFPPHVFRQANLTAFGVIVEAIRGYMYKRFHDSEHPRCLELYGGVGTIGLHIADLCRGLVSSDENPHNVACFEASAKILIENLKRKRVANKKAIPTIRYQPASASNMVESGALKDMDVVIVDPPRKGLEETVSAALAKQGTVKTLIYVSCGFEAFQRDYGVLTLGGWKLEIAEGHILFPGSDAIETLAFFTR